MIRAIEILQKVRREYPAVFRAFELDQCFEDLLTGEGFSAAVTEGLRIVEEDPHTDILVRLTGSKE